MSLLLLVHLLAFLFSFFVAGCLVGVLWYTRHPDRSLRLKRSKVNPTLSPGEYPWTKQSVMNPTALLLEGRVHLLYRAVGDDGVSRLGYASSSDGTTFDVKTAAPAYAVLGVQAIHQNMKRFAPVVSSSGSTSGGSEDPRMVCIDGRVYVTFNLFNGWNSIRTAVISISTDDFLAQRFNQWRGPHILSRAGEIHKNWILFPEKIGGKFALLHSLFGDTDDAVRVEYVDNIETYTPPSNLVSPDPLAMPDNQISWHARMKSAGPPPLKTPQGWLVLYHAMSADEPSRYKLGAMLLDLADPTRVIARASYPLLVPDKKYENEGKPGVVYACGAVIKDDTLFVYYGGGDRVVCSASTPLSPFLDALVKQAHDKKTKPAVPLLNAPLFTRAVANPILAPLGSGFESRATFNPAAIDLGGSVNLLYRAMGADNTSTIGLALSRDGVTVDERLPAPIYTPREPFELKNTLSAQAGALKANSGCEDPRIALLDERLYLTYTSYDGVHTPSGTISSISLEDYKKRNFTAWEKPHVVTPDGIDDKDFVLLSERVGGNYVLYHRIGNQICADRLSDLGAGRISRCIEILQPRSGMWDDLKVGCAGPLIKVEKGWLMIYHGISSDHVYRLGAALIAPDGVTLLARSVDAIFEPSAEYERKGEMPNVVFSCGTVVRGDSVYLYYGAADKVVGVAIGSLARLLASLK